MANTTAKKVNTTTTNNATSKKDAEIEALKQQNEQLKEQFVRLQQMMLAQQQQMTQMMAEKSAAPVVAEQSTGPKKLYDEVTLVHLVDRAPGLRTHMVISNLVIDMTSFGEERTLTLQQMEEVISRYRKFFDKGIIALGSDAKDIARRYNLKSVSEYTISRDLIARLGVMSLSELEEIYNKLNFEHRRFIIEYWKRQCIKKDPNFLDIHKIETLNRLSDGAMDSVLLDIRVAKEREAIAKKK